MQCAQPAPAIVTARKRTPVATPHDAPPAKRQAAAAHHADLDTAYRQRNIKAPAAKAAKAPPTAPVKPPAKGKGKAKAASKDALATKAPIAKKPARPQRVATVKARRAIAAQQQTPMGGSLSEGDTSQETRSVSSPATGAVFPSLGAAYPTAMGSFGDMLRVPLRPRIEYGSLPPMHPATTTPPLSPRYVLFLFLMLVRLLMLLLVCLLLLPIVCLCINTQATAFCRGLLDALDPPSLVPPPRNPRTTAAATDDDSEDTNVYMEEVERMLQKIRVREQQKRASVVQSAEEVKREVLEGCRAVCSEVKEQALRAKAKHAAEIKRHQEAAMVKVMGMGLDERVLTWCRRRCARSRHCSASTKRRCSKRGRASWPTATQ